MYQHGRTTSLRGSRKIAAVRFQLHLPLGSWGRTPLPPKSSRVQPDASPGAGGLPRLPDCGHSLANGGRHQLRGPSCYRALLLMAPDEQGDTEQRRRRPIEFILRAPDPPVYRLGGGGPDPRKTHTRKDPRDAVARLHCVVAVFGLAPIAGAHLEQRRRGTTQSRRRGATSSWRVRAYRAKTIYCRTARHPLIPKAGDQRQHTSGSGW